jgi:hypothetical protein
MDSPAKDRVYSSRKFIITIFCMILICAGGLLAMHVPSFAPMYATYIGGILGALGLFITGNVSNDFLNNKTKANVEVEHIKATGVTIEAAKQTANSPDLSEADLNQSGE